MSIPSNRKRKSSNGRGSWRRVVFVRHGVHVCGAGAERSTARCRIAPVCEGTLEEAGHEDGDGEGKVLEEHVG
jgi:hypothetical protein